VRSRITLNKNRPIDYIITTYNLYPIAQVNQGTIYYSIKVGDTDILTVYKMSGNQ
jgi:hypothetical protein